MKILSANIRMIFQEKSSCDGYFTLKLVIEKHREFNMETNFEFAD